jgi:hypothetical protein
MKKIAVNIVSEIDMIEAHNNVVDFLFSDRQAYEQELANGNIQIDYFVCHADVKEAYHGPGFENSTIVSTILTNEETMFNNVHNGTNSYTLEQVKSLFKVMYRSYINSLVIHKNTTKNLYDMVISYDHGLQNFRIKNKKNFTLEQDFLFINIQEHRWAKVNYKFYACATSTFFKIVNFWQFTSVFSDNIFKIWTFLEGHPDTDRYLLPMYLNNQFIKIRELNDL